MADPATKVFTARWEMTLDDYHVLTAQYCELTRIRRIRKHLFWVIAAVLLGLLVLAIYEGDPWLIALFVLYVAIAIGTRFIINPWAVRRRFRQQRLENNDVDLQASNDGVRIATARHKSELTWSGIVRVDRMAAHTILWLNLMQGVAVPDRAFATQSMANAFADFAKENASGETT